MKRFKELTKEQKKKAVDYMYRRVFNDVNWNGAGQPEAVQRRLKEITERIKFCGCGDCEYKIGVEISKDTVIKESVLERAQVAAESAYYPEESDTIIKVS
jgi:hypothetical protein